MRDRYEQAEEEAEGFECAELITEDHYFGHKNLQEGQVMPSWHLPKKKGRFQIKEKPKIKFAPVQLVPLTTRYNHDSQKYVKSMSLQKTNCEEPLSLHPPKQPLKTKHGMGEAGGDGQRGTVSSLQDVIEAAIMKTKRTQLGQDLIIRTDENQQLNKIKETPGTPNIVFKKCPPKSTHEAFREMSRFASSSFVSSKYNSLLRSRLQKCEGKGGEVVGKASGDVLFEGGAQSCNLQCVWQGGDGSYNVMLSVDTNTKGHQSWFYFHVTNKHAKQSIVINICNMKRKLPMVRNGQGVYCKREGQQWSVIEDVLMESNEKGKHKLSFQLELAQSQRVSVSLLPPYTYSHQLKLIQSYEASPHAKVEILTYSLAGLAIPVITLTKGARSGQISKNRNLYLITARIHPSETCSSFIVNALVQQLITPQNEDFLRHTVIKVVPMVNPDGVVFGNFRTNYLGNDLNRSFHSNDEAIFPEIVALKELGRKCKEDYGDRFLGLLDLHGHSSQPNSFIYGPQYPQSSESYVECRILAKILDRMSAFFSYDNSSFRLEQYKNNTARGYFSRKLKVPAYTIETSYALYRPKQQQADFCALGVAEWQQLGRNIVGSLKISHECLAISQEQKEGRQNQKLYKRRAQSNYKIEHDAVFSRLSLSKTAYTKFKQDILQEIKFEWQGPKQPIGSKAESESDGEGEEEDLSYEERSVIIRRLGQRERGKSVLPRVGREGAGGVPALLSNSYSPSLIPTFYIGSEGREGALQRMNSKLRNKRYNRPVSISQEYTEYLLRNITGVTSIKPEIVSFNPKICRSGVGREGV